MKINRTFLCNGHFILLPQSSAILPVVKVLFNALVKYGNVSDVGCSAMKKSDC